MRLPYKLSTLFIALVLLSGSDLRAGSGTASGLVLLRAPHARPMGFAEAYGAVGADWGGISAIHYNPASGGFLDQAQVSLLGQRGFAEDNFGSVLFGLPSELGTFAAHLAYYSAGDIDLITDTGASSTVKAEEDILASFNYSDRFAQIYTTGVNVKILRSKLAGNLSANAVAFDFGSQVRIWEERLTLGLAVQNMGSGLRYIDLDDPLPLTFKGGGALQWPAFGDGKIMAALDFVKVKDENTKPYIGLEYGWANGAALRGGYKIGQDSGKLNFGAGMALRGVTLDYAFTEAGDLGQAHAFSVDFKFDIRKKEKKRPARKSAWAPEPDSYVPEKKRAENIRKTVLAVMDLQPQGITDSEAAIVSDMLQTSFIRRNKFYAVVERKRFGDLLKEKYDHLARCAELECSLKIGRELNAERIIVGSIGKLDALYVLSVRVVDVRSGVAVYSETRRSFTLSDMQDNADKIAESFTQTLY